MKETCYFLNYNPMIIQIISLFLIFLTEAEAYFCIKNILESSQTLLKENKDDLKVKSMRWHITLEAQDFEKMCNSFFDVVQEKSSYYEQILNFFNKNNHDHIEMFEDWIKELFQGCFPLSVTRFLS